MSKQKTNNWSVVRLGELFHFHRESVRPGSQPDRTFQLYSLPAVDETGGSIPTKGEEINSTKYLLRKPTILVSKLNPRIPRVSVFNPESDSHPSCSSTEFMTYSPVEDEIDIRFYFHFFNSPQFQRRLERTATGTTNSHSRVTPSETLEWTIPHPSAEEQRRIADVLDTVDAAIQETDAVIAKQEQIKTGLLQDLLTRGLDADGRLRDPEQTEFQQTPIGRLPWVWDVVPISEVAEVVTGTTPSTSKPEYYGGPVPFTRPAEVGGKRYVSETEKSLTHLGASRARMLPSEAVLVTCIGDLGRVAQAGREMATNQQINSIVPGPQIDSSFLYYASLVLKRQMRAEAGLQVVPNVNKTRFSSLYLPLPPIDEQKRIVDRLSSTSDRKDAEHTYRIKLQHLKTGLMQDLLTGRVRVPEAEERVQDLAT